jgi:Amt family ammonium transporter
MLEAGHINAKNVKGVLLKNFSDNAIGVVVWVLFGWGLYEGDSVFAAGNGSTYLTTHQVENFARMFQQFGFACTATTLVSGSIIGRCKFAVYLCMSFFLTGCVCVFCNNPKTDQTIKQDLLPYPSPLGVEPERLARCHGVS